MEPWGPRVLPFVGASGNGDKIETIVDVKDPSRYGNGRNTSIRHGVVARYVTETSKCKK